MTRDTRLVVISGGGTGIGRAVAAAFVRSGDRVLVLGRREEPLRGTAEKLNAAAGREAVRWERADLRSPEEVAEIAVRIAAAGRPVDVLVNNAGGNYASTPPRDLAGVRDAWLANVEGNVLPVVLLTHALLPSLRRGGGRIITISSVAASRGPATYGGAKAALHVWSRELAGELAPEGITANVVAPGYVAGTEFYGERMNPEFHAGRAGQAPMGRGAEPAEVADLVLCLASAGFVTGEVIGVDGGALIVRRRP